MNHLQARGRGAHVDMAVVITFVAAVALEVGVYFWQAGPVGPTEGTAHVDVGSIPPTAFTLRVLGGTEQINILDLRENVVWLTFWGPWNDPSLRQMPELNQVYAKLRNNSRFELVTVLCEAPNQEIGVDPQMIPAAQRLIQEANLDLPIYLDETGDARRAFNVQAKEYPTNVILDAKGVVRGVWPEFFPGMHEEILPVVEQCLKELAAAPRR